MTSQSPTLQEQARALGDPTRHAVFRYVADSGSAVDVAELTEHFGLNHNAIRQHLAKLVDAELVTDLLEPGAPVSAVRVAAAVPRRQVASFHVAGHGPDYSWYDATELDVVIDLLA